ncbi:MAG: hypothetical protein V1897_11190 [Pseudomonadota bacterium]
MTVSLRIFTSGSLLATVTYKPGFLVDVKVARPYISKKFVCRPPYPKNNQFAGELSEVLDKYFNESIFESRSDLLPEDPPRVGTARDHKSLFLTATRILEKDWNPNGYEFQVSFE